MYSYFFNEFFYKKDIIKIINEIEEDRKKMRLIGETMNTTFAQDIKRRLNN